MMEIDYRELLVRYMAQVIAVEGSDFLEPSFKGPEFTPEEAKELRKISEEATEVFQAL